VEGGPKIAVFGAGSVGCLVGGAWQVAGLPVTFIGRQNYSNDIDKHGLTLTDYKGWHAHLPAGEIDYRCGPEALDEADIILVTVKSGSTAEAAAEIDRYGRDGSTVVSFQNGISNVDVLEQGLGGRFAVVRGMVRFNIVYLGDGRFHKAVAGDLWTERRGETQSLADQLRDGPAPLNLSDDMLGLAWGKLLINMNNAINALSGQTIPDELRQRDYRRVFAAAIEEGLGLLKRAEIEPAKVGPLAPKLLTTVLRLPDILFNRVFFKAWPMDAKARSSMSDDLACGRKTEVDYLNGELVQLADRLQREAPVNRAIVDLVHKAEAGAKPLGAAELRRAVLGS